MVALGQLADGRQVNDYAHRIAYQLTFGGLSHEGHDAVVRHRCDNPPCCNPTHLILGTQADNIADAQRQGKYTRERPGAWKIEPELRRRLIAEALAGPRGTVTRLAREYGLDFYCFAVTVNRARQRCRGSLRKAS